jgi:hypothetical protein
VTGATRLQVRRRGAAAITALLFVVCGVLAMRHEASTAHVLDRAGSFVHAQALAGHHVGQDSDIHGQRDPGGDAGDCAVLIAFHQAASAQISAPALVAVPGTLRTYDTPRGATSAAVTDVYRLAPKTSPPVAV